MIIKNVGKQYSKRPAVPIKCRGCGKSLRKMQGSGEICPKCLKDRRV